MVTVTDSLGAQKDNGRSSNEDSLSEALCFRPAKGETEVEVENAVLRGLAAHDVMP